MPARSVPLLLDYVRGLAAAAAPDERLLADYLARRDEAAFAALVGRHGPMVLEVGRRILGDAQTAEDVFQATFLLLAERAAAIRRRASLAGWLHGVSYRLAVRAKRQRAARAQPAADLAPRDESAGPPEDLAWREVLAILDEELRRLPDRLRASLVLCYLQGRTQDEAARQLAWSLGTLRRRLGQGRRLLEARLRGRGVSLPAALGGLLAAGTVAVPAPLQAATLAAARALGGTGLAAPCAATPGGLAMTQASVKKMAILAACGVALGAGLWLHAAARTAAPPALPVATAAAPAAPDPAFRPAVEAVEACAAGPQSFTLLLELAVQEAKRGHAAAARKRFQQAADRLAGQ